MGYTARIDKHSCQSSGNCVDAAPEAFEFDADSLAEPRCDAPGLPRERLLEVARRCPALAISVYDDQGHEVDLDVG